MICHRTSSSTLEKVSMVHVNRLVTNEPLVVYRDRENSTVFVADIPNDCTEEELTNLFKDVSNRHAIEHMY
jgi:RNA recognition motif-containing protein